MGSKTGLVRELLNELRLIWYLFKDPRVPLALKAFVVALALIYILLPIDLAPDLVPLLGQLDDVTVALLLLKLFLDLSPRQVVEEYRRRMSSIPGTYRFLDEEK